MKLFHLGPGGVCFLLIMALSIFGATQICVMFTFVHLYLENWQAGPDLGQIGPGLIGGPPVAGRPKFEKHIAVSCSTGLAVLVYCCGIHCSQIVFNAYDLVSSDKARHACIGCCT